MQAINFLSRGKSIESPNEWLYGSVVYLHGKLYIVSEEDATDIGLYVIKGKLRRVIPDTVDYFTGIEIGGEKVFFNDIVKAPSGLHLKVVWIDREMKIGLLAEKPHGIHYNFNVGLYTLCGNSHDNPELLENEEVHFVHI